MSNNSAFSYDSPVMQILMYIGDLIILNFLFIICSIPIFTIGAAHAGLYTAVKVLTDKEDDSSPAAAFFRGFTNGFLQISLAWVILAVLLGGLAFFSVTAIYNGSPAWLCILPLCIVATFLATVPAFHSRFGCTAWQLIRNCWFLIFAHPIRSLGAALLFWLPVILFLNINLIYSLAMTPLLLTLYFSTAVLFGYKFFQKPFNTLIQEFNRRQAEANANDPNALPVPENQESENQDPVTPNTAE